MCIVSDGLFIFDDVEIIVVVFLVSVGAVVRFTFKARTKLVFGAPISYNRTEAQTHIVQFNPPLPIICKASFFMSGLSLPLNRLVHHQP